MQRIDSANARQDVNGAGKAGFVVDFPLKSSIYDTLMNYPEYLLYSSSQLSVSGDLIKTVSSKASISSISSLATAYVAFRIPIVDVLSNNVDLVYSWGSYDAETGVATYNDENYIVFSADFFKNLNESEIVGDSKYLYHVCVSNGIAIKNYCFKITYNGIEHEARFSFPANAE